MKEVDRCQKPVALTTDLISEWGWNDEDMAPDIEGVDVA